MPQPACLLLLTSRKDADSLAPGYYPFSITSDAFAALKYIGMCSSVLCCWEFSIAMKRWRRLQASACCPSSLWWGGPFCNYHRNASIIFNACGCFCPRSGSNHTPRVIVKLVLLGWLWNEVVIWSTKDELWCSEALSVVGSFQWQRGFRGRNLHKHLWNKVGTLLKTFLAVSGLGPVLTDELLQ